MWPCRTARFGNAIISSGMLTLKRSGLLQDFGPLDPECSCFVCKKYTRAYLSNIFGQTPLAAHLVTYHNLHFMKGFMSRMRASILDGSFESFVNRFLELNYDNHEYPAWVVDALTDAGHVFQFTPNPCTKEIKAAADATAAAEAKAKPKDVSYQVKKSHVRQKAKTAEEKEQEKAAKRQKTEQEGSSASASSTSAAAAAAPAAAPAAN